MKYDAAPNVQNILMATGKGVRIAVLDSGRNPAFPKLNEKNGQVFDCTIRAQKLNLAPLPEHENTDRCNHGSVVETCLRNVAPHAHIDHYRILDADCRTESELLCSVLEHVVRNGYHVINLSLGTRNEKHLARLVSILKSAYENDVVLVASASNIGASVYPAKFPYCLSVVASPAKHPLYLVFTPRSVIEYSAWGVNVPVEGPGDETLWVTGSSYAAAHITGMAARAWQVLGEKATPLDVKMLLRNYAKTMRCSEENLAS
jgi:subtilisin